MWHIIGAASNELSISVIQAQFDSKPNWFDTLNHIGTLVWLTTTTRMPTPDLDHRFPKWFLWTLTLSL
ncbi:hypothetical protein TNCV_4461041 [Trichonephila clavipes]|nr:hypothetical protein TNCV_4461041 [Trichonephila clavipes]